MASNCDGRDIVIVGQQAWDVDLGSNCKNIAIEFSKANKVLYVNSPLDRITVWRNKHDEKVNKRLNIIKGKEVGLVKIEENLWTLYPDELVESINWITHHSIFNTLNRINGKRFSRSIIKAIKYLGFKDFILFNDNDIFKSFYLKEFLKPSISIYYSRDYMIGVDYWKRHGERLEPILIAKNDLCVANSVYLADYCKKYNHNSFYVGQGCDLEIFQQSNYIPPIDIEHIKRPIIGYVGALQSLRLSIDILNFIARVKPEWNIILVGPEDENFKSSDLHSLSNIIFLGVKSQAELPHYISHFDVCLNPQLLNEITIGNYPRKIDEYLAMGKPVVATKTQAMMPFDKYVYLANDQEEFVSLIQRAFDDNSLLLSDSRKSFASLHTWENSVAEIYKAIISIKNR